MGNKAIKAKYICMFIMGVYLKSAIGAPAEYFESGFHIGFSMITSFAFGVYLAASADLDEQKLKGK